MSRGRFTLRADISECYRSIYTHSIEWALHTKAQAKANLVAKGPRTLGGRLDACVRQGQEGQTKGIPVGPDTSRLLAELILCAVDVELARQHKAVAEFAIRFVDDLEFFARSRAEAEDVLLAWDSLLGSYDLNLNPTKTTIIEGLIPPEAPWRARLAQFQLRTDTDAKNANDLQSLFSVAVELAAKHPGDPVFGYAINRVNPRPTGTQSWKTFVDLLLASAAADPSCLRFVSNILAEAGQAGMPMDLAKIADTMNEICFHHAPLEHGSEVTWALSVLSDLGLQLSGDAASRIATMQDNCSLLLLMELQSRKRITGSGPNLSAAIARAEDAYAWKSEDWLLGYEAGRNGWCQDANFQRQAHWAELRRLGVAFFVRKVPVVQQASTPIPSQPVPSQPVPSQPVPSQPVPSQPVPSQPVPSQPVPSQPVSNQPVPSQPVSSQPVSNQLATLPAPTSTLPASQYIEPEDEEEYI